MEQISVFDIVKIGIGPSSSHTLGPWIAAQRAVNAVAKQHGLESVMGVRIDLFGSLALTGSGHGTDFAVLLGLSGEDYLEIDLKAIPAKVARIKDERQICLGGSQLIGFDSDRDLQIHRETSLPFHPNGLRFGFQLTDGQAFVVTYYSVGGGFVVREGEEIKLDRHALPFPIQNADQLQQHCRNYDWPISQVVWRNERSWRTEQQIHDELDQLWETMQACVYRGTHVEGVLPGGLGVKRRAASLNKKLLGSARPPDRESWIRVIQEQHPSFHNILKWVSCFAIATNEENADYGRVVTAPTNGAAGVIPAVLFYYLCFCRSASLEKIRDFLLVAGEIGSLFKKGATISAAMGGCQAEIGVSSAMAAAALTEVLGGTAGQALMAAEIAMEHHLGLTCDPVGGLVQIPCIERNSMGAIKAITAANLALESDPATAKVSLDAVIKTMFETAQHMNTKFKETSLGGLATLVPVNIIEC